MALTACVAGVMGMDEEGKRSAKRGVGLGLYGGGAGAGWASGVWPTSGAAGALAAAAGGAWPGAAAGSWPGAGSSWPGSSSGVGLAGWPLAGDFSSALGDPSNSLAGPYHHAGASLDLGFTKVSLSSYSRESFFVIFIAFETSVQSF